MHSGGPVLSQDASVERVIQINRDRLQAGTECGWEADQSEEPSRAQTSGVRQRRARQPGEPAIESSLAELLSDL